MPAPGGWAITETARWSADVFVRWQRSRRVLKFGSGFSFIVVASELAREGHDVLDSIDKSVYWSGAACAMAREHGLLERLSSTGFQ